MSGSVDVQPAGAAMACSRVCRSARIAAASGKRDLLGAERLQQGRAVQALHEEVRTAGREHGRGGEAVRDGVPEQLDLGRRVATGAVPAQDRAGRRRRRRRRSRPRPSARRGPPRARGRPAGAVRAARWARSGRGATRAPAALWGRSGQVQRSSCVDASTPVRTCPARADRLVADLRRRRRRPRDVRRASGSPTSGARDPLERAQRLLVGVGQRLHPHPDGHAGHGADVEQLAAAVDLGVQRLERRARAARPSAPAPRTRHRRASPSGGPRRRWSSSPRRPPRTVRRA